MKLNRMARSFNPKMLINPRSGWEGDFYCDEGSHEIKGKIIPVPVGKKYVCLLRVLLGMGCRMIPCRILTGSSA